MNRCVVVGAVPSAVIRLVEQEADSVVHKAVDDTPRVDGTHLILHVAAGPDLAIYQDWLDAAAAANARTGLTSETGLTAEVTNLLFHEGIVYVMRLLNDADRAVPEAVLQLLRQDPYQERPKEDDIPLGQYFTPTNDPVQYRMQRQLSLSSKTMEVFLRQLRDAVLAMQTPFPPAVQALRRTPPWNPMGGSTSCPPASLHCVTCTACMRPRRRDVSLTPVPGTATPRPASGPHRNCSSVASPARARRWSQRSSGTGSPPRSG